MKRTLEIINLDQPGDDIHFLIRCECGVGNRFRMTNEMLSLHRAEIKRAIQREFHYQCFVMGPVCMCKDKVKPCSADNS
jgi:hypothetical protein